MVITLDFDSSIRGSSPLSAAKKYGSVAEPGLMR
jgi:hypothetical protein